MHKLSGQLAALPPTLEGCLEEASSFGTCSASENPAAQARPGSVCAKGQGRGESAVGQRHQKVGWGLLVHHQKQRVQKEEGDRVLRPLLGCQIQCSGKASRWPSRWPAPCEDGTSVTATQELWCCLQIPEGLSHRPLRAVWAGRGLGTVWQEWLMLGRASPPPPFPQGLPLSGAAGRCPAL